MNVRAQFVKAMVNDAYDYAMESYNEKPVQFDKIYDVETSEGAYEQYTTVIGPGKLNRSGEGVTIPQVSTTEGFTVYIANFKYPVELPITNEAIDDNRKIKNFLKTWAQGLGDAARITQDDEHADIFNKGGLTTGDTTFNNDIGGGVLSTGYGNLCYDSVCAFNTSDNLRTAKSGLTYYNAILTAGLTATNITKLYQLIAQTNAYDEAGKRVDIVPDTLLVQFASDNYFTAKRILESIADVDAIQAGVTNVWKGKLNLVGWSALTSSTMWAIGCSKRGLKSLARMPLSIDYYENKSLDSQIVRARMRLGRGFTNFRFWAAANVTQS